MATSSVTKEIEFDFSPAQGRSLFTVAAGHDSGLARLQASCLIQGVRELLLDGVNNNGSLQGDVMHLCVFALDAANALHDATEGK